MSHPDRALVRIVNEDRDGNALMTRVYDEFGNELTCVTKVMWEAEVGKLAKATLDVLAVNAQLQAENATLVAEVSARTAEIVTLKQKLADAMMYIKMYQAERPRLRGDAIHTEMHQIEIEVWENMIHRMQLVRKEFGA